MTDQGYNRGAVVAGVFFVVVGTGFLLDQLDVLTVEVTYIVPILLIVLGLALLFGGRRPAGRRVDREGWEPPRAEGWVEEPVGEAAETEETVRAEERVAEDRAGGEGAVTPVAEEEERAAGSQPAERAADRPPDRTEPETPP